MRCEFKNYHPIVNFVYFVFVIGFAMLLMHPLCLLAALAGSLSYAVFLKGKKAIRFQLLYLLPLALFAALMNPAFNHEGVTVLAYLPSGNPLTLESAIYGLAAAAMLVSVISWFSCYHEIMTSDKFIYLFGRIIPSLSLILSMTLRFVPKFTAQLRTVADAQRCLGRELSNGNIVRRAKNGITVLSIMVTWALENAIETADSMKSRGYGLPGRSSFSIFRFDRRDKIALTVILALGAAVLVGKWTGCLSFRYFPDIRASSLTPLRAIVPAAYFALCMLPIFLELWEVKKWKAIESNT